jgi:hypothetical protein
MPPKFERGTRKRRLSTGSRLRGPRLPWPDGSERVFNGETARGALVARRSWGMTLRAYAIAYRRAAETLFDAHVSKRMVDNFIVFPLGFLWRQYVELTLKCLLSMIPYDGAERALGEFPNGHCVWQLWEPVREYLEKWSPHDRDRAHVDDVIRQLHEADPNGDGFRYPVSSKRRDRKTTLTKVPAQVDLGKLDRSMRKTANYLDGTVLMLADAVPDESDDW